MRVFLMIGKRWPVRLKARDEWSGLEPVAVAALVQDRISAGRVRILELHDGEVITITNAEAEDTTVSVMPDLPPRKKGWLDRLFAWA